MLKGKAGLSAYELKWIAVFAMALDHMAWAFLPLPSAAAQLLHGIGRLAAPIMCFLLSEGFFHTRSQRHYRRRLGLWAIPSGLAFLFYAYAVGGGFWNLGAVYALFLDLLALEVCFGTGWTAENKYMPMLALFLLSLLGDGGPVHMLWALHFAASRGDRKKQLGGFALIGLLNATLLIVGAEAWRSRLYQLGIFLAIPLLACYDGSLGGEKARKWFFYWLYPLHLLVIGGVKLILSANFPF